MCAMENKKRKLIDLTKMDQDMMILTEDIRIWGLTVEDTGKCNRFRLPGSSLFLDYCELKFAILDEEGDTATVISDLDRGVIIEDVSRKINNTVHSESGYTMQYEELDELTSGKFYPGAFDELTSKDSVSLGCLLESARNMQAEYAGAYSDKYDDIMRKHKRVRYKEFANEPQIN